MNESFHFVVRGRQSLPPTPRHMLLITLGKYAINLWKFAHRFIRHQARSDVQL